MKKTLLVCCLAVWMTTPALANPGGDFVNRACMIEGSFKLLGQTLHSKDCMQVPPTEKNEAAFKRACTELANTSAAMGGEAGTVTYLAQCELTAQGICKNMMNKGWDAYYYARSADDLAALPGSCGAFGGTWASGR